MTTALLTELLTAGYRLRVDPGDMLSVSPGSQLSADLRSRIAQHKPALLAALGQCRQLRQPGELNTPAEVLDLVSQCEVLGLDVETTGLDPRSDRIRLLSLAGSAKVSVVLDCFAHPDALRAVLSLLKSKTLIAHNAAFDLSFLWGASLTDPPPTICTMLLSQLVDGAFHEKGYHGLGQCCLRHLGQAVPKELQASDWSKPALTPEQIAYARNDALVLIPLYRELARLVEAAGLLRVSDIETRALPAFVWMSMAGVPFDAPVWAKLAGETEAKAAELAGKLDAAAPMKGSAGLFGATEAWNWNSPAQVKEVFASFGIDLGTTCDAQLAELDHPFAALLRDHREQATRVKMFGRDWLDNVAADGRVYPRWKQIGADTGRTACAGPNMQQIPRGGAYRSCVRAGPGKVLVKADYATLQMRIAAKWARDERLIQIFQADGDPHTATAQLLLDKQEVTSADRQIAKSANFGLLFGMSSEGLRVYAKTTWGVSLSPWQADLYRTRWFEAYPGLARWHQQTRQAHCKETRCTSGRRRLLPVNAPDTWRLNSPVQGDESDGLKLALALLWERRAECPGAVPVLAVHDEITVETPVEAAERTKGWLVEAMMQGMAPFLDPVPCRVDAKITPTWGG